MNDHDCDTNLYCYLIILSICFLNSSRTILLLVDILHFVTEERKLFSGNGPLLLNKYRVDSTEWSFIITWAHNVIHIFSFSFPFFFFFIIIIIFFFLIFQDINISISTLLFWMSRQDFRNARLFLPLYTWKNKSYNSHLKALFLYILQLLWIQQFYIFRLSQLQQF